MNARPMLSKLIVATLAVALVACGDDSGRVLQILRVDPSTSKLKEFQLKPVEGKDGRWTFTAKRKDGKECTGSVKRPEETGPNAKYDVKVNCPVVNKKTVDPAKEKLRACRAADKAACQALHAIALQYDTREHENWNYEDASSFFDAACAQDVAESCRMACLYHRGERPPVKSDNVKATKACAKGCEANIAESCTNLGRTYERLGDKASALKVFDKACKELSDGDACLRYGQIVRISTASRAADPEKALEYYVLGCKRSDATSCKFLGDELKKSKKRSDKKRALRSYRQGCELGNEESCKAVKKLLKRR